MLRIPSPPLSRAPSRHACTASASPNLHPDASSDLSVQPALRWNQHVHTSVETRVESNQKSAPGSPPCRQSSIRRQSATAIKQQQLQQRKVEAMVRENEDVESWRTKSSSATLNSELEKSEVVVVKTDDHSQLESEEKDARPWDQSVPTSICTVDFLLAAYLPSAADGGASQEVRDSLQNALTPDDTLETTREGLPSEMSEIREGLQEEPRSESTRTARVEQKVLENAVDWIGKETVSRKVDKMKLRFFSRAKPPRYAKHAPKQTKSRAESDTRKLKPHWFSELETDKDLPPLHCDPDGSTLSPREHRQLDSLESMKQTQQVARDQFVTSASVEKGSSVLDRFPFLARLRNGEPLLDENVFELLNSLMDSQQTACADSTDGHVIRCTLFERRQIHSQILQLSDEFDRELRFREGAVQLLSLYSSNQPISFARTPAPSSSSKSNHRTQSPSWKPRLRLGHHSHQPLSSKHPPTSAHSLVQRERVQATEASVQALLSSTAHLTELSTLLQSLYDRHALLTAQLTEQGFTRLVMCLEQQWLRNQTLQLELERLQLENARLRRRSEERPWLDAEEISREEILRQQQPEVQDDESDYSLT